MMAWSCKYFMGHHQTHTILLDGHVYIFNFTPFVVLLTNTGLFVDETQLSESVMNVL